MSLSISLLTGNGYFCLTQDSHRFSCLQERIAHSACDISIGLTTILLDPLKWKISRCREKNPHGIFILIISEFSQLCVSNCLARFVSRFRWESHSTNDCLFQSSRTSEIITWGLLRGKAHLCLAWVVRVPEPQQLQWTGNCRGGCFAHTSALVDAQVGAGVWSPEQELDSNYNHQDSPPDSIQHIIQLKKEWP